jgi:hypothetical protein
LRDSLSLHAHKKEESGRPDSSASNPLQIVQQYGAICAPELSYCGMHRDCANEALAPVNATAAAPSARPPATPSTIANLITIDFMFVLQFCFRPPRKNAADPRLLQRTIL